MTAGRSTGPSPEVVINDGGVINCGLLYKPSESL